jgi:hypothetical protein
MASSSPPREPSPSTARRGRPRSQETAASPPSSPGCTPTRRAKSHGRRRGTPTVLHPVGVGSPVPRLTTRWCTLLVADVGGHPQHSVLESVRGDAATSADATSRDGHVIRRGVSRSPFPQRPRCASEVAPPHPADVSAAYAVGQARPGLEAFLSACAEARPTLPVPARRSRRRGRHAAALGRTATRPCGAGCGREMPPSPATRPLTAAVRQIVTGSPQSTNRPAGPR